MAGFVFSAVVCDGSFALGNRGNENDVVSFSRSSVLGSVRSFNVPSADRGRHVGPVGPVRWIEQSVESVSRGSAFNSTYNKVL